MFIYYFPLLKHTILFKKRAHYKTRKKQNFNFAYNSIDNIFVTFGYCLNIFNQTILSTLRALMFVLQMVHRFCLDYYTSAKMFGVPVEEVTSDNVMDLIKTYCDTQKLTLHDLLVNINPDKKLTITEFMTVCSVSHSVCYDSLK